MGIQLESLKKSLNSVYSSIEAFQEGLKPLNLESLNPQKTALLVVDMVNGFAKFGALYSPRVESLISGIEALSRQCHSLGMPLVAFADSHKETSPELLAYPPHCMEGTSEAQLVEELEAIQGFKIIQKNSTNGYLEPAFQTWLQENSQIDTFVIVGDCTDICILQLALTLKCHFNRMDQGSRIIVPASGVNTFDFGNHHGEMMHAIALMQMGDGGVEVVRCITENGGDRK